MSDICNKTAVVSGASGVIGKSIAEALSRNNINLCLIGRDKAKLEKIRHEITNDKIHVNNYIGDLKSIDDTKNIAEEIISDNTHIDILIHSAGIYKQQTIADTNIDDFDAQYFINTRAPLILTTQLLPLLEKSKGDIVFINSSVALQEGKAYLSAYTASKYALKALSESLRNEVNHLGIRVLNIYPGRTATTMQEKLFEVEKREYRPEYLLQPKDIANSVVASLVLPKTAEITDIQIRPFSKIPKY